MPVRVLPLVEGEIYHLFNRGISFTPVFATKKDYQRGLKVLSYYQFANTPFSFSKLKRLSQRERRSLLERLNKKGERLVEILAYCLMPNHFHFLFKQLKKDGISKAIANFQNGYTRYFNLRNKRLGPLFQGTFKAVRIETDEQLIHVSRYIHLNPYSSLVVKSLKKLAEYPWSSFREYLDPRPGQISSPKEVLGLIKGKNQYKEFVFDQADYQKELEKIKHLILE